ncbi:MAG: hypothetical protein AB8B50_13300, partial [Pirellulaceae bacterium]
IPGLFRFPTQEMRSKEVTRGNKFRQRSLLGNVPPSFSGKDSDTDGKHEPQAHRRILPEQAATSPLARRQRPARRMVGRTHWTMQPVLLPS